MIITLKGADFSKNNIGPLSSWLISREIGYGARYSGPVYVSKGGAFSATVVLAEGYTLDSAGVTVIMGGTAVTSGVTVNENTITINIASVTGNVVIKVPTKNTSTGEEEEPETSTNYTFTINPNPTSATVTLTATGYSTVSGTGSKSITVANGTKVNWKVEASGYTTRTGSWTINGKDETLPVVLTATGGGGTGGDTSNLLTENPYFVTTGIPTQATTSSYSTQIGYDYGGFICKGIKSVSTGEGNSFNVYTGTKGSAGYIGNTEKVETFTYTKKKGIEEEFLFNSPIDLTGDTRLTCNGSFMWRQSTTEEQNNPPQGVRRLQTNTPLYYYWYIF